MTQVIDERVVEMRFDNKDFEKNVSQSMSTLDKLKKALKFDNIKPLENLSKNMGKLDVSGVSNAVEEVSNKFSVMEIAGITAIAKITSAAMDMGVKLVKSLSVDQISTGFNKYAEKTTAIQTIISATGESIEDVTEQIDKLNWFTDETSYNLTDMISNIAKFTNSGISLADAVPQMMGIAAAAGDAGKGVQGATHAMEGFSKAMAQGYMSKQTWKWIETSGIDTQRFRQAMIDAAEQCGTLQKVAEGMWVTMSGEEVTADTIGNNLKEKWMTAEVMQEGLSAFGEFSNRLAVVMDELGSNVTTSRFLEMIDDFREGTLDMGEAADECGVSVSELQSIMEDLASDEMQMGNHALKMSQEAKTFAEAIDSVKDAVSTGWMTTLEYIFGNYEQAKVLWTGLANDLWEVFAGPGAVRNEILGFWSELGGRTELIEGLVSAVNLLVRPLSMVKQAFDSLFPETDRMGEILYELTVNFRNFMDELQPSEETMNDLFWIFRGLFGVIKAVVTIVGRLVGIIIPINKPIRGILDIIIKLISYVGKFLYIITELITNIHLAPGILERVREALGGIGDFLRTIAGGALTGLLTVIALIGKGFSFLVEKVVEFVNRTHPLEKILKVLSIIFGTLAKVLVTVGAVLAGIVAGPIALIIFGLSKAATAVANFINEVKPIEKIGDFFSRTFGKITEAATGTTNKLGTVIDGVKEYPQTIKEAVLSAYDAVKSGSLKPIEGVKQAFGNIGAILKSNVVNVITNAITKIQSVLNKLTLSGGASEKLLNVTTKINNVFDKVKTTLRGTTKEYNNQAGSVEKVVTGVKKMETYYGGANEVIAQSGVLTRETTAEVKESTTVLEKLINILKKVGTVFVSAGALILGVFVKLGTAIANFFKKAFQYGKDIITGTKTIGEVVREIFGNLIDNLGEFGEKIKGVLEYFGLDWDKITEGFGNLTKRIKDFFGTIDAGKVAAIIFSAAMIGLAGAIIKMSDSFKALISGITGFFNNINKILKKQFFKSTPMTDFANGIATIAASLALLTLLDQESLKNVAKIMKEFAVIGLIYSATMGILAGVMGDEKLSKRFETNSKLITSLAGSLVLLSGAMFILSKIDIIGNNNLGDAIVQWIGKLIIIFAAMMEMAVTAWAFQKLAPKLTLSIWSFAALAAAFAVVAHSLKDLGEIKLVNVQDNLWQVGLCIAAFGAMLVGVGNIKLTSGLAVIFLANAIQMIMPVLTNLIKTILGSPLTDQVINILNTKEKAAYALSAILAAIGAALYGLGSLSKLFLSIGVASASLAVGVWILVKSINSMVEAFNTMSESEVRQAAIIIGAFTITIGAVFTLITVIDSLMQLSAFKLSDKDNKFKIAGQKFLGMGIAMLALAASMHIMVSALKKLGELAKELNGDTNLMWTLVRMLTSLTLVFGAAVAAAGYAARGKHAMGIIAAMLITLGSMVAAIAALAYMLDTDKTGNVKWAILTLGGILTALAILFGLAGAIKYESGGKMVLGLAAFFMILFGFFAALAELSHSRWDTKDIVTAGIIVAAAEASILIVMGVLNAIAKHSAPNANVITTLAILEDFIKGLAVIAIAIAGLALVGEVGNIRQSAIILGVLGGALVGFTALLNLIAKHSATELGVNKTLEMYGVVLASIGVFALILGALSKTCNMQDLAASGVILSGMAFVVTILTTFLNLIAKESATKLSVENTILMFVSIVAATLILANQLKKLALIGNVGNIAAAAGIITTMTGIMVLFTYFLNLIAKGAAGKASWQKTIVTFGAVIAAVFVLASAIGKLAKVDSKKLAIAATVVTVMTGFMLLLTEGLMFIATLNKKVNLKNMIPTFVTLAAILVQVVVLAGVLYGLAGVDPQGLKAAADALSEVMAVIEIMVGIITFVSGMLTVNISTVAVLFGALIASCVQIYLVGEALMKVAQFPVEQIKQAGTTIWELIAIVNAIVVLMTVVGTVVAASQVGLIGLVVALVAITAACISLYEAGEAMKKAGTATVQLTESLERFQNLNFTSIENGFKSLGNASGDIEKFANSMSTLAPHLGTFETFLRDCSGVSNATSALEGTGQTFLGFSENGEAMIETVVKADKTYDELVTTVESGTLTLDNSLGTAEKSFEDLGTKSNSVFDSIKKAWNDIISYWDDNRWDLGQAVTKSVDSLEAKSETFEWKHPILNSILGVFEDSDVQSRVGASAESFGSVIGVDIANGIASSLGELCPQILANIQGLFGGIFTFGSASSSSYRQWAAEQAAAGEGLANTYKNKVNPILGMTEVQLNNAAGAAENFTQKAGSPELSKATQNQNKYNAEASKSKNVLGLLGEKFESAKVKAENYYNEVKDGLDITDKVTEATEGFADAMEDAGGAGSKGAKGVKDFMDSLKSTLESQMDIFSKFELKTETSATTMIENMKSNVDAYASWSHRMAVLSIRFAEQGIDQGLLGMIAELGPKGFDTMNAFYQMTDEQLAEAGKLYQDSLVVQDAALKVVGDSYAYCGEMAVQGWSNALNEHINDHTAIHGWADDQLKAFKERMGIASPSTVFEDMAIWCLKGFNQGLLNAEMLEHLSNTIKNGPCFIILRVFKLALGIPEEGGVSSEFVDIGKNCLQGIIEGLSDQDLLSQITEQVEYIASLIPEKFSGTMKIESPSKVMRGLGVYVGEGLALGIKDSAKTVIDATESIADGTIESMSTLGRIQDVIDTSLDLNPVITPLLDLSSMRKQMNELNSMMSDPVYDANLQNGGSPITAQPSEINFTQNNYSPKALSRMEIYRQTKNQLSMMKGVVMANA